MSGQSFIGAGVPPSAILSDGLVTLPLYAVSTVTLSQSYHLPPLASSGLRTAVGTHDDTLSLSGLLVGPERFRQKFELELLAESSRRGSVVEGLTGGAAGGLVLITSMTVRTDLQVQSLSFTSSAARRDVLDVSMTLVHMPRPGITGRLLEVASLGVRALADFGGR
ncbi:hypothetical protein [Myxococcus sp. RHSTA-1-4]|uniref:hypothetical protein n=1 Tax=Myxococcus sp. RHSTA-1-4 TaxID=2874601 RepID=UPI001CBFB8C0|nr:hypothetical protein [Myxococcus sp. RHSTA-1-4]MBZ4422788.1 hypothetical protein [Myxococcus sp. RHSTA-1-4]